MLNDTLTGFRLTLLPFYAAFQIAARVNPIEALCPAVAKLHSRHSRRDRLAGSRVSWKLAVAYGSLRFGKTAGKFSHNNWKAGTPAYSHEEIAPGE